MRKFFLAILPLAILAACNRANDGTGDGPADAIAPPSVEIREVAAADGYGKEGDVVKDVAFWAHPNVNFAGLVLAATDTGLATYNIEFGEPGASAEFENAKAVDVAYVGAGATARGFAIVEEDGGDLRFYEIDNTSMALWLRPSLVIAGSGDGFCAGPAGVSGGGEADFTIHRLAGERMVSHGVRVSEAGVSSVASTATALPGETRHCAVDVRSGAVYAIDTGGALFVIDAPGATPRKIAETGITDAKDIAAFAMASASESDTPCCTRLAVLSPEDAVVYLFDGADGHALGAVQVKATFDLAAITSATALGAGAGNFGGVFRDGVMALATDVGAPIRLVAWNGVIDATELELGEGVSARPAQPVEEEDFSVISIEVIEP